MLEIEGPVFLDINNKWGGNFLNFQESPEENVAKIEALKIVLKEITKLSPKEKIVIILF